MHSNKNNFLTDKCSLLAFSAMEVSYKKESSYIFSKRLLRREHRVIELLSTNSYS